MPAARADDVIVGIGIDVCDVARLRRALTGRTGERFRERVFTAGEVAYCEGRGRGRVESYAARFAAKEAVAKALGTGIGGRMTWRDVAVVARPGRAPMLRVAGRARQTAEARGVRRWHVTLTHAAGVAIALVVAEGRVIRGRSQQPAERTRSVPRRPTARR
jgi:holo-[acyl-carrier protein] synthase